MGNSFWQIARHGRSWIYHLRRPTDDEDDDRRACRHSFHSRSLNLTSPLSFRPLLSFLCRLVAPPREQPARTRCHRQPAALHVLLIHDAPHASLHTRATLQSFGVLDLAGTYFAFVAIMSVIFFRGHARSSPSLRRLN